MSQHPDILAGAGRNIEHEIERYEALLLRKEPFAENKISSLLQAALDLEEDELILRCYLLLTGYQSQIVFDYIKALGYAKLALQYSEDLPDLFWRIQSLNTAANSYHMVRDYATELNLLHQSLALLQTDRCNSIEFYPLHQAANFSLGVLYNQMGMYSISQPYIETALKFCEVIHQPQKLLATKLALANILLYRQQFEQALLAYQNLLHEFASIHSPEQIAIIYNYIGLIYLEQNNLQQAEIYVRQAVQLREQIGNELRTSYSYTTFTRLLYKTGRTSEADTYFNKLMEIMDKYPQNYDFQLRHDVLYEIFAAKGDYRQAYEHFRKLDVSFVSNQILEQTIQTIFKNERDKQQSALQDADQLRRVNEEIHRQASQLESVNKDLKNYARTASHDLREPLRMVSTYMTILEAKLKDKLSPEEKQFLHFAVDGSKRMDEMITRILNAAKGNSSVLKPVDLNSIAAQLSANLSKLLSEKNAQLSYSALPTIVADDIQMLQVFQNLVTNAIKYNNSQQPLVNISAQNKNGFLQISVADNGLGIPPEAREKVFEMFSRVQNQSGADGTGIGLSTVKTIIEKMKGKIWIEANQPAGSVFHILLPNPTS